MREGETIIDRVDRFVVVVIFQEIRIQSGIFRINNPQLQYGGVAVVQLELFIRSLYLPKKSNWGEESESESKKGPHGLSTS